MRRQMRAGLARWEVAKASGAAFLDKHGYAPADFPVDFKYVFDGLRSRPVVFVERGLHQAADVRKLNAAIEESCDRHFVGGIEHGRRASARFQRLSCEAKRREPFLIRLAKVE